MAGLTAVILRPLQGLAQARGTLFPWVPMFLGAGVGIWFALGWEPGVLFYALSAFVAAFFFVLYLRGPDLLRPLCIAASAVAIGLVACGLRVWVVDAPMLGFRYYGPVTGRVVDIDRSRADALRMTLDSVWLERVPAARTPERVRISLRGREMGHAPEPGEVVMVTAHLAAPDGPIEPNSFDFRRMAYFAQLGAVGYSAAPVVLWREPATGARPVDRLRRYLSASMLRAMPSQAGAYAAGAMTGDRSAINQKTVQDLRDSSLAHLLAISGMNLAFLITFTFALIRYGLALVPPVALRVNTKKVAALVSLGVAGFYLALSGSNVATERAFIMVSVMLGAVLLDRKALTLRSVAIAGVALLLWKPESMLEPGFQMSFAATVGLIAGFRALDRRAGQGRVPRWAMPAITLVLSSLIGGFSTAPFAAAHFNRFTVYGLIANLLTVPVMGAVVMPAGAMAALLAPLGLGYPAFWVMEQGSAWILWVAHWVSGWEGAVTPIVAPGPWALPLISFGGAWLILWRGKGRWLCLVPMGLALAIWLSVERPLALISPEGGLVGVLGPQGRAFSAQRGAGFAARSWLENDGDLADQATAYGRRGFDGPVGQKQFTIGGVTGIALKGKGRGERIASACAAYDLVVSSVAPKTHPQGCVLFDPGLLAKTGTLALYAQSGGLRVVATKGAGRVWSAPENPTDVPEFIWPRAAPPTAAADH